MEVIVPVSLKGGPVNRISDQFIDAVVVIAVAETHLGIPGNTLPLPRRSVDSIADDSAEQQLRDRLAVCRQTSRSTENLQLNF